MSNAVWFNCTNGLAGDMLLASLVDAGASADEVVYILNGLHLPDWAVTFEKTSRAGVAATRAIVVEHSHNSDHQHRRYKDVLDLINKADLPIIVRERALHTFAVLAAAEAAVHGVEMAEVEFHEVGSVDSIIDIVGVCAALEVLGIDYISCSPIAVGHGSIAMSHGNLPNPGPAVARMLADHAVPLVGVDVPIELSTPTGVALMIALATEFGAAPAMTVTSSGHGAGTRDTSERANVVQALVGQINDVDEDDSVVLLETNVDDITPEVVAYTIARLMDSGALDAWAGSITMKKSREGVTISTLCNPHDLQQVKEVLLAETGSLGARISTVHRAVLAREVTSVSVDGHTIRIKVGPTHAKVEFEDAATAARELNIPLREVIARAENEFRSRS